MEISKIAVFGAGTMGSAIAQHFCMKGFEVYLVDLKSESLEKARSIIGASLNEAKDRKIMSEEAVQSALGRMKLTTNMRDIAACQLVVEAVFEDREIKRKLFRELERVVNAECILASNTSSYLVTDLAVGLKHPERLIGVHYFYHAAKNKLIEIIAGEKTAASVVDTVETLYRNADKIPIRVKDAPGFAVNRFFVPWLNEATRLFEEGLGSIAFIDETACKVFQIGMGPFALMNATGVPISLHAARGLAEKLGGFYTPSKILEKQVAKNQPWDLTDTIGLPGGHDNAQAITERLLAASVGIAASLVVEGVADAGSVDLGARVGLRWTKGPFELIKARGQEASIMMINKCMRKWGQREVKFPEKIEWVRTQIIRDTAFVIFDIPDRMNPLSEEVVEALEWNWNQIENSPAVNKVFFLGRGKAFVAGADIKFFLDAMDKGDYARITRFSEKSQKLFSRFANSSKTTIAYLNGLTLGGGLELALSCKFRVASTKALLAFPETGIGIYPGLGGTQRTSRLLGKGIAKYLIATGAMLDAEKALRYGLVDRMIDPVKSTADLMKISDLQAQVGKAESLPEDLFADFNGESEALTVAVVKENEKLLKRKAPKALKLAMRLIDEGYGMPLDDGLKMELQHLEEIFRTKDARAGLDSVIAKTRPEFQGQ